MSELNEDIINIEVIQNITNVETQIDGSTDSVLLNVDRTYSNIDITLASTGEKGDPGTTDHPLLDHLDYESSGHTGFASELEITEINQTLSGKVDKITGKGLSTNDYSDLEKTKLAGIESGAEVNVNADWNSTSGDSKILNKPYIPTNVSDLNNDSGFITTEVDPVFTSSAAHSISNADITNWNDAYSKEHIHTNKTALDLVEGSNKGDETNASIISKIGYTPENISNKGIASGYVPLNTSTKIDTAYLPDSIVGQLHYVGTWNATTNTPTIISSTGNKGDYYIVSVSGFTTVDGISDWVIGDWLVFNGSTWDKIDNTDSISSFNGRTGAITLISNDVTTALGYTPVTNTRTLTINGSTYDLSANRTWNVGDILSTGSYINPSWITSLSWNKITSTPTTLSGYGISSTDTLFDTKYQPMLPSTPINPTQMYLNGNLQWSTISVGNGGYAANLYNSTTVSTIVSGYSQLSYTPDASETQYTNTITNQEVLFRTYLYESTINTNVIDAGLWTGSFTAKVSNAVGVTQLKFEPFLRHTDGTETTLFSVYSPEIDNTDFITIKLESSQGLFNVATTDRFGLRVYGKTTSGAAITITTIVGDGRGGYIVVPVRLRHNQLRDLNGDTNYLHSTQTQQNNWNSAYTFTSNYATNYPDLTAIENLSGTSGLLRKTASNTWSLDTTSYQGYSSILTSIAGLSIGTGIIKLTNGSATLDTATYVKNGDNCSVFNDATSRLLKGITITSTDTSTWNPQTLTYQAWGQKFINTAISTDSGDIVWWLRPSQYSSNNTELNVSIDGDFYAGSTNKVWHAGNLTNNNQLSNGAGYLTGITSTQVTNALGYTPYNSTNPNGYITSSALNGYATQTWVGSNYQPLENQRLSSGNSPQFAGITSTSFVVSNSSYGFRNNEFVYGYNPIWCFNNAPAAGLGYYQVNNDILGKGQDGIGFHFGNTSTPPFYVLANGAIYGIGTGLTGTAPNLSIGGTAANANYLNNMFGNETIIHNGYANAGNGSVWINYRGAVSAITNYSFANGLNTGTLAQITASQFNGSGAGLTGTASNLSIGGSASYWGGYRANLGVRWTAGNSMPIWDSNNGEFRYGLVSDIQSWLGLGSNAYTSTAYLPLTGGTLSTYAQYGQINDVLIINGSNVDGNNSLTTYYGGIKLSGNGYDWGAIRTIQSNPSSTWDNRLSFFTMNGNGGSLLERMSISNNGNVLIGTTTDYGSKLYVNGNIKTPAGTAIFSPMFYDSDDTSYYLDPGANSVLNTLTISGGSPSAGKVLTATDTSGNCTWQSAATTTSGTYTPTVTATNCTVTLNTCTYMKVGTIVHVKIGGNVSYGTSNCSMLVSLPYTSSITTDSDAGTFILGSIGANYFSNANGFVTTVGIYSANTAGNNVAFTFSSSGSNQFVMQFDYVTS